MSSAAAAPVPSRVVARSAGPAPVRRARKVQATPGAAIVPAVEIARGDGLERLAKGVLAERLEMSKSGVFAHFGSREDLQLAVLKEYAARFVDTVLRPAVARPRGLPRLRALLQNWLALLAEEIAAGCILIGGASEYDDRPGPLHDALVQIVAGWKGELLRAIAQSQQAGHLVATADAGQMVFEIYGLMLMLHQDARLLHSRDGVQRARAGLARLIESAQPPKKQKT